MRRREESDVAGIVACAGALDLLSSLEPEHWAVVTFGDMPVALTGSLLRAGTLVWSC